MTRVELELKYCHIVVILEGNKENVHYVINGQVRLSFIMSVGALKWRKSKIALVSSHIANYINAACQFEFTAYI